MAAASPGAVLPPSAAAEAGATEPSAAAKALEPQAALRAPLKPKRKLKDGGAAGAAAGEAPGPSDLPPVSAELRERKPTPRTLPDNPYQ